MAADVPLGSSEGRRALVTGAAGFAGQWLCRDLVRRGWRVTGSSLAGDPGPGILSPEDHALVTWRREDLRDAGAVHAAFDASAPDAVFHLAGVAFVPDAGDDPMLAFDVNVGIAVRLMREARERRAAGTRDPVMLFVGSGEQYGRHDLDAMPLGEEAECRPCSLYAATKMAQEVFALEAFRSNGLKVICTRSFNHSGRGQRTTFLLPALVARARAHSSSGAAERAERAERGERPRIAIGNTGTVRDFLHVEDAVRAYVLLAERGLAGEVYNVCSGQGVSVGDVALDVLRAAGIEAELEADPGLRRAVDVPVLVGRNDKLRSDTGWIARHTRADIISDLLHAATH